MIRQRRASGMTLIEIVAAMLIISLMAALALPSFRSWTANSQVRSVAETVQNGLRAAQVEALRRSRQTAFVLTNSAPTANAAAVANGTNWYVQVLPLFSGEQVQDPVTPASGSFGKTVSGVAVTGPAQVCFNSMGRLVTNAGATFAGSSCTAQTSVTTYDLTRANADHPLEVQVQPSGQIRICDKTRTLSANAPDGC
ncbi:MAG TPA: type II secretion system protein [Burkholderiaceae bacterium]